MYYLWRNYDPQLGGLRAVWRIQVKLFFLSEKYLLMICRLLLHACPSPPGYELGYPEYQTEEAQDRRRGLLKEVCSQERAISEREKDWSVFSFQNTNTSWTQGILFYFLLLLARRHVIGTQKLHVEELELWLWYAPQTGKATTLSQLVKSEVVLSVMHESLL